MNENDYDNNLNFLLTNNIEPLYAKEYAKLPQEYMNYLIQLSKIMSQENAYSILLILKLPYTNLSNINKNKMIKYNFCWTLFLLDKEIDITVIKILLSNYVDFYYLEISNINKTHKNSLYSLKLLNDCISYSEQFKINYYKLRAVHMLHLNAYSICKNDEKIIDNIINLINIGYNDKYFMEIVITFTEDQLEFLKFSRLGFSTIDEFNQNKKNIYENVINKNIIMIDNFKFIEEEIEPFNKKIKF